MRSGRRARSALALPAALLCATALAGCAVVSVAGTAVGVGASAVGLAASAAVGTARLTGKAAGAAIDALSDSEDDNSGIRVRFREPTEADRAKRRAAEQQARDYEAQQADQAAQAGQAQRAQRERPTNAHTGPAAGQQAPGQPQPERLRNSAAPLAPSSDRPAP